MSRPSFASPLAIAQQLARTASLREVAGENAARFGRRPGGRLAIAGCTLGTPATPSPTPPKLCCGPPTPTATAAPTASPAATPSPTVPPIILPTPGGTTSVPCPTNSAGQPAVPPDAHITSGSGTGYSGKLGSYTFCGTSADALPPKAANVPAVDLGSSSVRLQMDGGWGITGLKAGLLAGCCMAGRRNCACQRNVRRTGDWHFLQRATSRRLDAGASLTFPAGGNATYYWHVAVP